MVCIYCGQKTQVTNSRLQHRANRVWRRRQCATCGAVFSSLEQVVYETALIVRDAESHIIPFNRDTLFVSLYESCKHRKNPTTDASALTDTVISKLLSAKPIEGTLQRDEIVRAANNVLKRFDVAAQVYYEAFHPFL